MGQSASSASRDDKKTREMIDVTDECTFVQKDLDRQEPCEVQQREMASASHEKE